MDEIQFKVQQRVAKKLSALRQTLTGEERQFLDELITGRVAEVDSHQMAKSATPAPDEVVAHKMDPAVEATKTPSVNPIRQARFKIDSSTGEYKIEP